MKIDHIFIFSSHDGKEADALVDFGLTEGSSRVHPGQGTTNRKFYFENFFLEILWVINKSEIKSELTSQTKLWERSQFKENGYSPFGLCLVNSKTTDSLFEGSEKYQPHYFPEGMYIDMITNNQNPNLPWTFRLPYREIKKTHSEPTTHKNGIRKLTQATFEIPFSPHEEERSFRSHFLNTENLHFKNAHQNHLILGFDHHRQKKVQHFQELNLIIKF